MLLNVLQVYLLCDYGRRLIGCRKLYVLDSHENMTHINASSR